MSAVSPSPVGKRRRTDPVNSKPEKPEVEERWKIHHEIAFLGPEGTYGQQAAKEFVKSQNLPTDLKWTPCPTIGDAYRSLSRYTVLPLVNTIYGPVNETLDCLFSRLDSEEVPGCPYSEHKTIVATLDLPISHCLVVKKGTLRNQIKWVRSHEQALGQSAKFLDEFLPDAKRIPTASTALAAESLLTEPEPGAAICSKTVVDSNPTLEVLHEGTQDCEDNYTKFILLIDPEASDAAYPPKAVNREFGQSYSHFYVCPPFAIGAAVPDVGYIEGTRRIESIYSRPYRLKNGYKGDRFPQCVFFEFWIGSAKLPFGVDVEKFKAEVL